MDNSDIPLPVRMAEKLPLELVDQILDHVGRDLQISLYCVKNGSYYSNITNTVAYWGFDDIRLSALKIRLINMALEANAVKAYGNAFPLKRTITNSQVALIRSVIIPVFLEINNVCGLHRQYPWHLEDDIIPMVRSLPTIAPALQVMDIRITITVPYRPFPADLSRVVGRWKDPKKTNPADSQIMVTYRALLYNVLCQVTGAGIAGNLHITYALQYGRGRWTGPVVDLKSGREMEQLNRANEFQEVQPRQHSMRQRCMAIGCDNSNA